MNLLTYIYIVALFSAFTLFSFYIDTTREKNKQWRIPLKSLILMTFMFGSLGGILATFLLGYKEKKIVIANLVALLVHISLGVVIYIAFGL